MYGSVDFSFLYRQVVLRYRLCTVGTMMNSTTNMLCAKCLVFYNCGNIVIMHVCVPTHASVCMQCYFWKNTWEKRQSDSRLQTAILLAVFISAQFLSCSHSSGFSFFLLGEFMGREDNGLWPFPSPGQLPVGSSDRIWKSHKQPWLC